ncbi:MAG: hypothetical protein ACTSXW_04550 [Candidatus Baldrarchaeia archaeon]
MQGVKNAFEITHDTMIRLDAQKFIVETWRGRKKIRSREISYSKVHTIILARDHSTLFFNIGYILLLAGIIFIATTTFVLHGFGFLVAGIAVFYVGKNKDKRFIILVDGEGSVELPFSASNVVTLIENKVKAVRKIQPGQSILQVSL